MKYAFESLPENLAAFCATLRRDHRFLIGPLELQEAVRALEWSAIADERAVRDTLRPVLTSSLADVRAFDRAFDRFFHGERGGPPARAALASSDAVDRRSRPAPSGGAAMDDPTSTDLAIETVVESGDSCSVSGLSETDDAASGVLRASYSPFHVDEGTVDLGPVDRAWREAATSFVRSVRVGLSRR